MLNVNTIKLGYDHIQLINIDTFEIIYSAGDLFYRLNSFRCS